ncbi:MAG: DUF1349 domain-containing protein [Eubacteriales bacterium]|nr:DUF1349 domain-containing protein [Eubacteriales bacterium]
MQTIDFTQTQWLFPEGAADSCLTPESAVLFPRRETDLWQRSYYLFQHDNAPALLFSAQDTFFSFTVRTDFSPVHQFDQCGVLLYQDADNWCKASIEYENERYSRLGSVVTNLGYSDWATTDIPSEQRTMYYRLSRRNNDFCLENSADGTLFRQMRIFHLHKGTGTVRLGIYACCPVEAGYRAAFSKATLGACQWRAHGEV